MRKLLFILFLAHLGLMAQAQTKLVLSQWNRNWLSMNPAYAGIAEAPMASFTHRSQWVGVDGAPSLQNLEFHAPLKKQSIALGFQFMHKSIGAGNYNDLYLNYAYRMPMFKGKVAMALKLGINTGTQDPLNLRDDEIDPAFDLSNKSYMLPNMGIGAAFYKENYYLGFSIPSMLSFESSSDGRYEMKHDFNAYEFILNGGWKYQLTSRVEFEPYASLILSPSLQPQISLMLSGTYKDMVLGGIGIRTKEAIVFGLGYKLNQQFSAMYNYEANIGDIGPYARGSHEIGVVYRFGYVVNASSPRNF